MSHQRTHDSNETMRQILLETAETDTRVKLKLEGGQTVNGKPVNIQESRPLMAESDEENPPWGGAHIRFSLTADEIPTEHEVEQNPNHYAIVEIEENLSTEEWFCPQINWWAEKSDVPNADEAIHGCSNITAIEVLDST